MTLPNNFSTAKQKLAKIWEQAEANKIQINVQLETQDVIIKELNKTAMRTFDNNQILNLDIGFSSPIPQDIDNNGKTQSVYQKWEIDFTGIKMEELIGCQINLVYRYGTGNTYLDTEIYTYADIFFLKFFTVTDKHDSRVLTKKLLCGLYIDSNNFDGLVAFDDKNMQVGLNIRFPNPRYYN